MKKLSILSLVLLGLFCSCVNQSKNNITTADPESSDQLWHIPDSIDIDKETLSTCISEDGKMRFHSWNTGQGGTCPDFGVLCQFLSKDGKAVTIDMGEKEEMPAWVSSVHSIKKDDGTTYYITVRSHRASSNDGYMWLDGFMIDNDTLKNVAVFDGGDDLDECGLEINYVISDWYYTTNGEGWDWLFEYDAKARDLYIPIVTYVDETIPVISDRYRLYHFNGKEFVEKGDVPHKNLHQSLSDYVRLVCYFRTKDYIVRIDNIDGNGTLRYASWSFKTDMSEQPDLVIIGGKYDDDKDIYTFTNGGYEYIVGYSENTPVSDGVFEHHEYLLVKKDGHVVFKDEKVNPFDE